MSPEPRITDLAPWIELLCEAGDGHVQDRVLLECVLGLGAARAAALWRRAPAGAGTPGRYRLSVSRGAVESLPDAHEVAALASGELPAEALSGKRVVAADTSLLALGGVSDDEDALDLAASLFLTHVLVRDDDGFGDDVAPPLPARTQRESEAEPAPPSSGDAASASTRRLQHDVRNVLASLRATEDLLVNFSEGLTPEETTRFRAVVEEECRRAGRMVAGALLGSSEARGSRTDASRGLERVLDLERAACERVQVRLVSLRDPAIATRQVALSETEWARVVHNLLVNAREALAPGGGGTIWVTLDRALPRDHVETLRLVVEDDGPGIPEEHLERVQFDGVSLRKHGTGQGLAIVRELARRAGGELLVSNRASGGARIEVRCPSVQGRDANMDDRSSGAGGDASETENWP